MLQTLPADSVRTLSRPLATVSLHHAYYTGNFGDMLLGRLFSRWIREAGADRVVCPFVPQRLLDSLEVDGAGRFAALARSSAVLFGGGGYFGEQPDRPFRWAARNSWLHSRAGVAAMLMRKRIGVIGVGVGPIAYGFYRQPIVQLCAAADVLCVRDQQSADFLVQNGVPAARITVVADAALTITMADVREEWRQYASMALSPLGGRRTLVLHLQASRKYDEQCFMIAKAVRAFVSRRPEWKVAMVTDSFQRIDAEPDAPMALSRIAWQLSRDLPGAVQLLPYAGDPGQLIGLLSMADAIVTTKLHVGIVGASLGKSVISFAGHTKTERLYQQLGCPTRSMPLADVSAGRILGRLAEFIDTPLIVPQAVRRAAEGCRDASHAFVAGLDYCSKPK